MKDLKQLNLMEEFELKSQISEVPQKSNFNYHVWINVPLNEYKFSVIEAYGPNFHKSIYNAFQYLTQIQYKTRNH